MNVFYLLLLITANPDGSFTVSQEERYDYGPTCEIAREGRQMLLNGAYESHKEYICIEEPSES